MADKTFRCKLITREERVLDAEVTHVEVPLWDGQAGFLAGAAPFVAKLGVGELRVQTPQGAPRRWFVEEGFMQTVGDELTLLTKTATPVEDLDEAEAKAELAEANARVSQDTAEMDRITGERDRARAKLALSRRG